jgi:hypothetical protein
MEKLTYDLSGEIHSNSIAIPPFVDQPSVLNQSLCNHLDINWKVKWKYSKTRHFSVWFCHLTCAISTKWVICSSVAQIFGMLYQQTCKKQWTFIIASRENWRPSILSLGYDEIFMWKSHSDRWIIGNNQGMVYCNLQMKVKKKCY